MKKIIYISLVLNLFFVSACKDDLKNDEKTIEVDKIDTLSILEKLIDSAAEKIISEKKISQPQIEITNETGDNKYCYLDSLHYSNDDIIISVDFVQWVDDMDSPSGFDIINENPKLRYFIIDKNTIFSSVEYENLNLTYFVNNFDDFKNEEGSLYSIDIDKGRITNFKKIFLP